MECRKVLASDAQPEHKSTQVSESGVAPGKEISQVSESDAEHGQKFAQALDSGAAPENDETVTQAFLPERVKSSGARPEYEGVSNQSVLPENKGEVKFQDFNTAFYDVKQSENEVARQQSVLPKNEVGVESSGTFSAAPYGGEEPGNEAKRQQSVEPKNKVDVESSGTFSAAPYGCEEPGNEVVRQQSVEPKNKVGMESSGALDLSYSAEPPADVAIRQQFDMPEGEVRPSEASITFDSGGGQTDSGTNEQFPPLLRDDGERQMPRNGVGNVSIEICQSGDSTSNENRQNGQTDSGTNEQFPPLLRDDGERQMPRNGVRNVSDENRQNETGCEYLRRCWRTVAVISTVAIALIVAVLVLVFTKSPSVSHRNGQTPLPDVKILNSSESSLNDPTSAPPMQNVKILNCSNSTSDKPRWLFKYKTIVKNGSLDQTSAEACGLDLTEYGNLIVTMPPRCPGDYDCEINGRLIERYSIGEKQIQQKSTQRPNFNNSMLYGYGSING